MTDSIAHVERSHYFTFLAVCVALVALPFFVVQFIPSTDLPQHLAQIRLLEEIMKNPHQTGYTVDWLGANTLVYYLLRANWSVFEPIMAGKMAVTEIALAWVVGIFALARHRGRSVFSAILAAVFVFNAMFSWGFLNFLIGFPVFVLWFLFVVDPQRERSVVREFAIIVLLSAVLFLAHTVWLLMAILHLVVTTILRRPTRTILATRCAALAPIAIYSMMWFPKLAAARTMLGFDTVARWNPLPWERLHPQWLVDSFLGGLRGPAEALILAFVVAWIGVSLVTNWGNVRAGIDWEYFIIGALLLCVMMLAPEKYVNTIFFASRWAPISMIFFVLAIPAPRVSDPYLAGSAVLTLAILSFTTAAFWYRYETTENTGLSESLKTVEDGASVLGLSFAQESEIICGRPFLQLFAYAQVLHGSRLNFSFAEHHSGIVSFATMDSRRPWTLGLEWLPHLVKYRDFFQFDYVLMSGSEAIHREIGSLPVLRRVTSGGVWQLYRCMKDSTAQERR